MASLYKLFNIVLDTNDLHGLAQFYCKLLDVEIVKDMGYYLQLSGPDGGVGIGIQQDDDYQKPSWPNSKDAQGQMEHLDFLVTDVEEAVALAESLGATKADAQFIGAAGGVTMIDPSGHPFCVFPSH